MRRKKRQEKIFLGTSHFAAMHPNYPREKALKTFPSKMICPGTAILYGVFGERNFDFAKMFIDKFQYTHHCIEFHLCFRRPNKYIPKAARKITREMEKIRKEHTRIFICPVLEYDISNGEWLHYAAHIRRHTDYPLVRSSLKRITKGGFYQEKHGMNPVFYKEDRRCIANMDGISTKFADGPHYFKTVSQADSLRFLKKQRGRRMALLWYAPGSNGLGGCVGWSAAGVPNPKDRKFVWPKSAIRGTRKILLSAERYYHGKKD